MSKPAATLTGSLLALKGRASTAGFRPPPEPPLAPPATTPASAAEPLLKARQPRPETRRKTPNGARGPRAAAPAGASSTPSAETVRLSYRMAPAEHRRFALLAAHLGKSKQQLIDEALAAYMARCGSEVAGGTCACLGGAASGEPTDSGPAVASHAQPSPAGSPEAIIAASKVG